ncbi:hypothetical protein TrST_g10533 [Triparma strigata]|uniref:Ribosomal RNA-processing protein 14/surfeit locus protein 6 C-terminal domain-containing protein n=1 Tax=Triparma strigata TaxID=1606541 RepID=A0A9W6ZQZ8_9STRA|nr:hypothetical protein TrST_g10533 [Triparma strigata]
MTMIKEALSHQAYFDSLTNMIPSSLYITETTAVEDDEKGALHANKFKKGQNKESKERRKAEEKLRKKQKWEAEYAESTVEKKKKKWEEIEAENDRDSDSEGGSGDEGEVGEGEGQAHEEAEAMEVEEEGLSKIEILRKKLALKIEKKRNGRPENGAENVSKRAARKAAKMKKKAEGKKGGNIGFSATTKNGEKPVRGRASTDGTADSSNSEGAKNDSVSHDLSTIDFGGISGLKTVSSHKANKSLSNVSKSKNLNHLLEKANAKKQRLQELKNGSSEDKKKREGIMWGDAMKEANGVRVRDDPAMIKKAIKRKEKSKAKSAAKWADRITTVADSMMDKQKIRKHNLEKRKLGGKVAANLSHKEIRDEEGEEKTKRRRLGVGFEGKKEDFLNGGKKGGGGKGGDREGKQ